MHSRGPTAGRAAAAAAAGQWAGRRPPATHPPGAGRAPPAAPDAPPPAPPPATMQHSTPRCGQQEADAPSPQDHRWHISRKRNGGRPARHPHLHIRHVAGGHQRARHARRLRRQQLLLDAAHRQHQAPQRQLPCSQAGRRGGRAGRSFGVMALEEAAACGSMLEEARLLSSTPPLLAHHCPTRPPARPPTHPPTHLSWRCLSARTFR